MWPIDLSDRLPVIRVPLRGSDPDVPLDLQAAFDHVYDSGAYDVELADNYAADPPPPPIAADALAWCRSITAAFRPA